MLLLLALLAPLLAHAAAAPDLVTTLCNSTAFPAASGQRHLVCYAGSFLLHTLDDLKANKTVSASSMRARLVPYLGGPPALAKLLTETAQDRGCTVCYTDAAVKAELEAARATLGAERTAAFDKLGVCGTLLADRMLDDLPRSDDGQLLVVHPMFGDEPLKQVEGLFRGLFMDHTYSDNSCRKSRVSAMHGGKFRHGGPFGLRPQGIKVMGHGGGGFPSFIKHTAMRNISKLAQLHVAAKLAEKPVVVSPKPDAAAAPAAKPAAVAPPAKASPVKALSPPLAHVAQTPPAVVASPPAKLQAKGAPSRRLLRRLLELLPEA